MSESRKSPGLKRRQFLAGAAAAGPAIAAASLAPARGAETPRPSVPAVPVAGGDQHVTTPAHLPGGHVCGADHMTDVLKALDIEYVASNPGSTFRGFQESIVNYGRNTKPEFLTALHEDSSVHFAQGYAKIAGKPMAAMVHGVVGVQHAAMAIYNSFADQVPVYVIAGNVASEWTRRQGAETAHSSIDQAQMVRDYIKWDEQPVALRDFSNAAARCYEACVSGAPGPVMITADADLQEEAIHEDMKAQLRLPRIGRRAKPVADSGAIQEIATMLCNAENPVIAVDRYGTASPEAIPLLVQLAEALEAPVIDQRGRMAFPNRHPLNITDNAAAILRNADVMLALEPRDLFAMIADTPDEIVRNARSRVNPNTKVVRLGISTTGFKPNYAASQRYANADLEIPADAEATMPALIEEVRRQAKPFFADRGDRIRRLTSGFRQRAREEAVYGWDASPISVARLCAELWDQVKNEEYSLTPECTFLSWWPQRLWNMDKYFNYIGRSGANGVGYSSPATVGAALANKPHGRLTIGIVGDGDFMMQPGVLWTAAHHKIPVLFVIHNNRGYHQEVMHIQRMANRHNRGIERSDIGTTIKNPNMDYAAMAMSMGVFGAGPIENPNDLGPAIRQALAVVKGGEPALIDVVSQPR
jgi:thiamine pyrophosphate-dependent acetolactate synthase large subunit-like protein